MRVFVELTDRERVEVQERRRTELKPQTTILDGIMGRILGKIAVRLVMLAGIAAGLVILAVYLTESAMLWEAVFVTIVLTAVIAYAAGRSTK